MIGAMKIEKVRDIPPSMLKPAAIAIAEKSRYSPADSWLGSLALFFHLDTLRLPAGHAKS
jgi:hypothetical protein